MRLLTTRQFEKDLKRGRKRGKNLDTLWSVVERLLSKQPLDPRHRRHRLTGDWSPCWECHIEPDWLLVWEQENDTLILVRTGTPHSPEKARMPPRAWRVHGCVVLRLSVYDWRGMGLAPTGWRRSLPAGIHADGSDPVGGCDTGPDTRWYTPPID